MKISNKVDLILSAAPWAFLLGMLVAFVPSLFAFMLINTLEHSSDPICSQPINTLYFNNEKYTRVK